MRQEAAGRRAGRDRKPSLRTNGVPLIDLERQHGPLRDELLAAIGRVIDANAYVGGPEVEAFEAEFAAYCGSSHCVAVANGTDALIIALDALGIGPGDEVITGAVSFFATSEAISRVGATPVFCDIDPATATLDTAHLDAAVTPRTRAIVPVHLYGQPADMDAVLAIARRRGLAVVEDCAQAAGARHRGRRVGGLGDAGCFSFYPTKTLGGMGDGGAIVTRDVDLARRCRMLANHGGPTRYDHQLVGYNSRLDALQAAVLRVKLPHLDEWNAQRIDVAHRYESLLAGSAAELLTRLAHVTHVYHLYVVRVVERDRALAALRHAGVGADVHYPQALPLVPAHRDLGYSPLDVPVARRHAVSALSLPTFPGMREDEVERVVALLLAELGR